VENNVSKFMHRLTLAGKYYIVLMSFLASLTAIGTTVYAGSSLTWDSNDQMIEERFPEVRHMSTDQLSELLMKQDAEQPLLLDARTGEEYEVSHIYGALRARKKREALKVLDGQRRDRLIVVYCSVGYRSSALAEKLQREGFTRVFNLKGSVFKWVNEGHKVYRGDRQVAVVHPYSRKWGQLLDKRFWSHSLK
jgi:rhodanese-related sulfurtransferase